MGLKITPDPEKNSNAPRGRRDGATKYYTEDLGEWYSSSSGESDSDSEVYHLTRPGQADGQEADYDTLETGGLTDREIDRLDGKISNRLGKPHRSISKKKAGGASASVGANADAGSAAGYPDRETGANTGPKGVIADQKYHHQQQLQERLSSHQAYNERLLAKAPMTTTYRQDAEKERQEKKAQGLLSKDEEAAKKVFGSLMEMNAAQYVNAIDAENKDIAIVIHIYSDYHPACKKLDGCLIQLAGRYATTKFTRIKAREVDFDEEVCPTVLVYRAGELIANLVMITYELSENYDDVELEELFTKHKVLSPHDQYHREASFFESSLDPSMFLMASQLNDLNMMSLGLGVGDASQGSSSIGGGSRRGILSGNVKEFRYRDYEDDEDGDDDEGDHNR
ncbi:MAG: thioredoxin-like protein [Benniella sp.]|nr:MAG: thioredoxin-like protein [Benniella sp.]